MISIRATSNGLTFTVWVQPRSARIAIVGSHQKALKIKLTAPPVGGAANKQCIQILAKELDMPKSALSIVGGQTSRLKRIRIRTEDFQMNAGDVQMLKEKLSQLGSKSA